MDKRGQTWVETVIYTLIALSLMGLVLSYVRPKVEEYRDRTIIEQSIKLMKDIDETILGIGEAGNQRIVEVTVNKGELRIDGIGNFLSLSMESSYAYSEPGGDKIYDGNIGITTKKAGKTNIVNITRDYFTVSGTITIVNYDLKYNSEDRVKTFTQSSTPHKILIASKKTQTGASFIDFSLA